MAKTAAKAAKAAPAKAAAKKPAAKAAKAPAAAKKPAKAAKAAAPKKEAAAKKPAKAAAKAPAAAAGERAISHKWVTSNAMKAVHGHLGAYFRSGEAADLESGMAAMHATFAGAEGSKIKGKGKKK